MRLNNNCKCLVSNLTNMSNYHSLEVVGRGRETQLQVGEKLTLKVQGSTLDVRIIL